MQNPARLAIAIMSALFLAAAPVDAQRRAASHEAYVGTYRSASQVMDVRSRGGRLTAQIRGQQPLALVATGRRHAFELDSDAVRAGLRFRVRGGRADSLTVHQNGRVMPFRRVAGDDTDEPDDPDEIGDDGDLEGDEDGEDTGEPTPGLGTDRYAGSYRSAGQVLSIRRRGDGLVAQMQGQRAFGLVRTGRDRFRLDTDIVEASIRFHVRGERATSLTVDQDGRAMRFQRDGGEERPPIDEPDPDAGAVSYAGTYRSSSQVLSIRERAGGLVAQMQGQPSFRLERTGRHRYRLDTDLVEASIRFHVRDERVTSLSVLQHGRTMRFTRVGG